MRLDSYLAESGLTFSRAKAQEMIKNGAVSVNGKTVVKAAFDVSSSDDIHIEENPLQRYVGRGGLKLEGALKRFSVSVVGKIALDIGASSGGFTDCLLQNGASYVYAVDSGSAQLHPTIAGDERVKNMENTNARYLSKNDFSPLPEIAVMDVSFISQTLILPAVADILPLGGRLITLIKPQFELERSALGKNGIVKEERLRKRAVEKVKACALSLGFDLTDIMQSVITGTDGNVEYVAAFTLNKKS